MLEETRPTGHGRARGLVSSRVSGQRVEAHTFAPTGALSELIEYYWVTRWDLRGQDPHVAEILADPCVDIAFEEGSSRVVGVSTRLFRRELAGEGCIRAVKLRSGSARAVVPVTSIADLTDRILPIADVFGASSAGVEASVLSVSDDADAFGVLESWLATLMTTLRGGSRPGAAAIVARIAEDSHLKTTRDVALATGVAIRPLQRVFRDEVGVSPKWVIRRFRLQEVAVRLERGEHASLARLAADLGYSDHAHLTRDFTAATGRSPSEFSRVVWE